MKLKLIILFSLIILLSNCITVFKKERFTERVPYNSPRLEGALFILDTHYSDSSHYGNSQDNKKGLKSEMTNLINSCRCFTNFTVITKEEDASPFKGKYNYTIEIKNTIYSNTGEIMANVFLSALTVYLIPTWNTISTDVSFLVKDSKGNKINSFQYANSFTMYQHLLVLFAMPFREINLDFKDIFNKGLYDIYTSRLIPLSI